MQDVGLCQADKRKDSPSRSTGSFPYHSNSNTEAATRFDLARIQSVNIAALKMGEKAEQVDVEDKTKRGPVGVRAKKVHIEDKTGAGNPHHLARHVNVKNEAEQAKNDFLKKQYEEKDGKGESYWKQLAEFVMTECKDHLQHRKIAASSYRIKEQRSLREKIEKIQGRGLGECMTLDSIQATRWDIVGTRICLYFPSQIMEVRNFMENHELFKLLEPAKPFRERAHKMKVQESRPYEERMG